MADLPEFVSQEVYRGSLTTSSHSETGRDTNLPCWVEAGVPPLVVLLRTHPGQALRTEERSESAPPSLQLVTREPMSVPDLMAEFGWARKTVYRRLKTWLGDGTAQKVSRGRYLLLGPCSTTASEVIQIRGREGQVG
jgi:hypothetical protein